jgi:formate hydrogenlyase subunit 3/multisubunit Na+/H+ antiporter MnhD subunit
MDNYILSFITWLPAVGAILILALMKKDQSSLIKRFATVWFGLDFLLSLWLLKYNRGMGGMQFLEDHQWIPVIGARYQMGVDGVAVLLIVLTTLLGAIAALSSWEYIQKREKEYYVLLLLLQTAVIGVFASMDLFLFYLFFEVSLVPMYFLIGIWGGENRLYAAIKFFLYTLVGSVVMLLGVLKMYFLTRSRRRPLSYSPGTTPPRRWSRTRCSTRPETAPARSIFFICRRSARCCPWARFRSFCSSRSRSALPSRCRCFLFTRGCLTRTWKHQPPARSFSRASC